MSNVLYISCHSVLENDELKILKELGHQVFSCGSYINPKSPSENIRNSMELVQRKEWIDIFHKTKCKSLPNGMWVFSKEFIKEFDTIIFMHSYQSMINSIKMMAGKKIYWRSIGQSNTIIEKSISRIRNDIKIVRYSPMECMIPGYCGDDSIIRFYKDKLDYKKNNASIDKIIIFYNSFLQRKNHFNFHYYNWHIKNLPHDIYGGNNITDNFKGQVSFSDQIDLLSKYRSSYIINTYPAQYTLSFIESLAAEIPIIIDKDQNHIDERYSLLESNDIFYSFDYMNENLNNQKIEIQNRVFQKHFNKLEIKKEWNKLL